MSEIIWNEAGTHWMTKDYADAVTKMWAKGERYINFFHKPEDDIKRKSRQDSRPDLKYAYIVVGKTQMLAMVDMKTDKAYKIGETMAVTNIPWKKFVFVKWCTTFDL